VQQRWHAGWLLLTRCTQQGRAGRAGQGRRWQSGSKAGSGTAGNGISNSEMFCLKKKFKVFCEMVLTFQKLCAYNRIVV
jgi:hypothetical protein